MAFIWTRQSQQHDENGTTFKKQKTTTYHFFPFMPVVGKNGKLNKVSEHVYTRFTVAASSLKCAPAPAHLLLPAKCLIREGNLIIGIVQERRQQQHGSRSSTNPTANPNFRNSNLEKAKPKGGLSRSTLQACGLVPDFTVEMVDCFHRTKQCHLLG